MENMTTDYILLNLDDLYNKGLISARNFILFSLEEADPAQETYFAIKIASGSVVVEVKDNHDFATVYKRISFPLPGNGKTATQLRTYVREWMEALLD